MSELRKVTRMVHLRSVPFIIELEGATCDSKAEEMFEVVPITCSFCRAVSFLNKSSFPM